jgi:hypothetical protein
MKTKLKEVKMNKIVIGIMAILLIGIVSAVEYNNIKTDYNKKQDKVIISFDKVLNNECDAHDIIKVFDKKGKLIAENPFKLVICQILVNGKPYTNPRASNPNPFLKTGTFHKYYEIDMPKKSQIKGLGNLMIQINDQPRQKI